MTGVEPIDRTALEETKTMKKASKGILMGVVFLGMNLGLASGYGAGVISVSPSDCQPYDHKMASLNWYAYNHEAYFDSGYPNSGFMTAPVSLPHLATITGFTAIVTDNGSGLDDQIFVALIRQNIQTGVRETLASVNTASSFASTARQTLKAASISYTTVDNENYTYSLQIRYYIPRVYLKFPGANIKYWSVL